MNEMWASECVCVEWVSKLIAYFKIVFTTLAHKKQINLKVISAKMKKGHATVLEFIKQHIKWITISNYYINKNYIITLININDVCRIAEYLFNEMSLIP